MINIDKIVETLGKEHEENLLLMFEEMCQEGSLLNNHPACHKSTRIVSIYDPSLKDMWDKPWIIRHNYPAGIQCQNNEFCKKICSKICVHAEQNALASATRYFNLLQSSCFHLKFKEGKPVVSGNPSCVDCSKLLYNEQIKLMWLWQEEGWTSYSNEDFHILTMKNLGFIQ